MGLPIYFGKYKFSAIADFTDPHDPFSIWQYKQEYPSVAKELNLPTRKDKIIELVWEWNEDKWRDNVLNQLYHRWNICFGIGILINVWIPLFYLWSFWEKDYKYYDRTITLQWWFINQSFTVSWVFFYLALGEMIYDIYYWHAIGKDIIRIWIIVLIWIILFVKYYLAKE